MDPVIILAALDMGYLVGSSSFVRTFLRLLKSEKNIEDLGIGIGGSKEIAK